MAVLKKFDVKLKSLRSTHKITKAMKMVAASKLRKAHQEQAAAELYAHHVTALTSRICSSAGQSSHPLLIPKPSPQKAVILIITSDKGLCGAFNHNANRRVAAWIGENRPAYQRIELWCCGKKGVMYFEKHDIVKAHYEGVTENPQFADAVRIGGDLSRVFLDGGCDEVYLSYNQFLSPLVQKTVFEKILPIKPAAVMGERSAGPVEYIFEPQAEELLKFLIPHFFYFRIYFALLGNAAGEQAARMMAMDNAAKNAAQLIDRYTLSRNRARQAAITTELAEIVSGAEALRN